MGNSWKDIMLVLLVVAILVILMRMSKVMQMQSETLLGVATKLGVTTKQKPENAEDAEHEEIEEENEESEESEENEESEESEENDNVERAEVEEIRDNRKIIQKPKVVALPSKPEEPKKSRQEIFAMIMKLFEDGTPRKRKDIEKELNIPNLRVGYMSDVISKMRDKEILGAQYIDKGDKWKSYYIFGLPNWFDDNKLKSEFSQKLKA